MKRAYYYLFYKFYKFGEWSPSIFPSDFTAAFSISCLEVLFLISLKFYYIEFIDQEDAFTFFSFQTLISLLVVFLINYFAFIHNSNWKKYIREFDKMQPNINLAGTFLVIALIAFVIGSLALAFHIMEQITGIH
ncbi:hypothetical protein [Mucilaginibacter sp. KACC 22063]|uniref:hypothetical protein n=1 Tax=Mucilaginibacter sp. KACC 22063 TaxID=3025666 RepID=UPI002365849D|nr:hypothetical protein [Mucilaginibacter sp. KACC 22063]WDF55240.1 hypothetical protein PQ461_20110 [Mucilaginibacter sp. KACC 22063]